MRNAAPGFNSMPARFPNKTQQPQRLPCGRGRKCLEIRRKLLATPSQANCNWGITAGACNNNWATDVINLLLHNDFDYVWDEWTMLHSLSIFKIVNALIIYDVRLWLISYKISFSTKQKGMLFIIVKTRKTQSMPKVIFVIMKTVSNIFYYLLRILFMS